MSFFDPYNYIPIFFSQVHRHCRPQSPLFFLVSAKNTDSGRALGAELKKSGL